MSIASENNSGENDTQMEDVRPVSPEFVSEIVHALENEDREQIDFLLEPLHSADVADVFEQLDDADRKILTAFIGPKMEPDVLSELDASTLDAVLNDHLLFSFSTLSQCFFSRQKIKIFKKIHIFLS